VPGGAAGLQNQSGGRKAPGGFDSLPSPPKLRLAGNSMGQSIKSAQKAVCSKQQISKKDCVLRTEWGEGWV